MWDWLKKKSEEKSIRNIVPALNDLHKAVEGQSSSGHILECQRSLLQNVEVWSILPLNEVFSGCVEMLEFWGRPQRTAAAILRTMQAAARKKGEDVFSWVKPGSDLDCLLRRADATYGSQYDLDRRPGEEAAPPPKIAGDRFVDLLIRLGSAEYTSPEYQAAAPADRLMAYVILYCRKILAGAGARLGHNQTFPLAGESALPRFRAFYAFYFWLLLCFYKRLREDDVPIDLKKLHHFALTTFYSNETDLDLVATIQEELTGSISELPSHSYREALEVVVASYVMTSKVGQHPELRNELVDTAADLLRPVLTHYAKHSA